MRNAIRRFVKDESGMEMVEWTIVAVVLFVAVTSLLAAYLPSRRAGRVEPLELLRED